jgi:mannose-6-phosphate isomerase-like protein (cupin superfamily)
VDNFYDDWLRMWDTAERERREAPSVIHKEDLAWTETVQDHRAALLVSPENGFRTWGSTSMIAEIPPGCHTGKHKHGEEAMLILEGTGFSVIDDVCYDWKKHSAILVPYGAVHQHFNTGNTTIRYLAMLAVHMEHYFGLSRTTQLEPRGTTTAIPDVVRSADGLAPGGADRVVLHYENSILKVGAGDGVPLKTEVPAFDRDNPLIVDRSKPLPEGFHKSEIRRYMRINRDLNDFHPKEVEISALLTDPPHEYGGTHAHMEAHLYVLEGEGYSIVDGREVPWKPGSCLHVPGPQTSHQHISTSDAPTRMVRMAVGLRYYFEQLAKREFPYLYLSARQAVVEKSSRG